MPSRILRHRSPRGGALAAMLTGALVAGGLAAPAARAQGAPGYTFARFDIPGAANTYAQGLNDAGQVVGYTTSATGTVTGFRYDAGRVTVITGPGGASVMPTGIDAAGQVAGFSAAYPPTGFLSDAGGVTTITVPGAYSTTVTGIDAAGQILGEYQSNPNVSARAFLDDAGRFTLFDPNPPGAVQMSVTGVAGARLVGFYQTYQVNNDTNHGFVDDAGRITTLDVPGALATEAFGINATGQVVGEYLTDVVSSHGFVENAGRFTTLDVPDATFTYAEGINAAGQVVGYYMDATGTHGFVATPTAVTTPEPGPLALLAAGLGAFGVAVRRDRRARQ